MLLFARPSSHTIQSFIQQQSPLAHSYSEVGQTRTHQQPRGFNNDFNVIEIGKGEAVFSAAKEAIRQWKMFPGDWAYIVPANTPIREGEVVAMIANVTGLWWLNSCRIVYVLDNERQFGFAYGTLPGHVECGEELFLVEMDETGVVRYSIRAFSRPRHWMARLAYPLARAYQRKFVRDSKASMFQFVQDILTRSHGDTE